MAGRLVLPCALGRSGTTHDKREGDGATPVGRFRALQAFYRPDRVRRPPTRLIVSRIDGGDGWCDEPGDRNYNRPVRLPYPARHERMCREDELYDVVVDLACNRGPIRKGRGSAIFLHCAKPGFPPTEGCVAVALRGDRAARGADRAANLDRNRRLGSGLRRPVCPQRASVRGLSSS